jgi:predicted Zn-dependent protease
MSRELDLAHHRWQVGDINGATQILRAVLAEDPDEALAHAMLAGCLLDGRRIHAALHEVGIALAIAPDLYLAQLLRGQILAAHRRFDEAEAHLAQLVQSDPQDASLYRALADRQVLRGESGNDARRALLAKALELDPSSPATLSDCAHFHLTRREIEDAALMATRALEANPEHLAALYTMGEVKLAQGDADDARQHAALVLSQNAEHRGALTLLAKIKASRSPLLGTWWRFVSWVGLGGEGRAIIILALMYVGYRFTSLTLELEGYVNAYSILNIAWLGFVIYCLVAPVLFRRALQRELAEVKLKQDF